MGPRLSAARHVTAGDAVLLEVALVVLLGRPEPLDGRDLGDDRTAELGLRVVAGDGALEIAPLANLPVIRDLVTDMRGFFDKWAKAKGEFVATSTRSDPFAKVESTSSARGRCPPQ